MILTQSGARWHRSKLLSLFAQLVRIVVGTRFVRAALRYGFWSRMILAPSRSDLRDPGSACSPRIAPPDKNPLRSWRRP
jgi:hypothetical protein